MLKSAVLTLYKQNCMKRYVGLTEGQYSCWGYYDGMGVVEVKSRKDVLIENRGVLNLMGMWYQMSEITGMQDGTYSQQSFGIFREDQTGDELNKFLAQNEVFQAACLIQLENAYKTSVYDDLKKKLEGEKPSTDGCSYTNALTFRTLDNVDMIILIRGNSYRAILNRITDIGKNSEILYTYSVCGVDLRYWAHTSQGTEIWQPDHSLVDDDIYQITTRIVADPSVNTDLLCKMFGGEGEWSWVMGNADIEWRITENNQKIKRAIDMIGPYQGNMMSGKAVANHLNPLYGDIIYNITTEILAEKHIYIMKEAHAVDAKGSSAPNSWCRERIHILKGQLSGLRSEKNDMLYSYYSAMIQSLTMIASYEDSRFAKDIFYMVFPSLLIFYEQFDKALDRNQNTKETAKAKSTLINNLTRYLDLIDQVIGRTVHADHTFFMLPGGAGALYPISLKLCLMDLAFMYAAMEVLSDGSEKKECCLYPVINATPTTEEIDFALNPEKGLIELKISQRSMYCPQLILVLLMHEISHYQGERLREQRADRMGRVISYVLTEAILGIMDGVNKEQEKYLNIIFRENYNDIQYYIQEMLEEKMYNQWLRMKQSNKNARLYFRYTCDFIIKASHEIMADKDGVLRGKIQKKSPALKELLGKGTKNQRKEFFERVNELEELYEKIESRLITLTDDLEKTIREALKTGFKETFADVVALYLIGFQKGSDLWKEYIEAFKLSEGRDIKEGEIDLNLINRVAVVVFTLSEFSGEAKECWKDWMSKCKSVFDHDRKKADFITVLSVYANTYSAFMTGTEDKTDIEIAGEMPLEQNAVIMNISAMWSEQVNYLKEVISELSARLKPTELSENQQKALKRIRELYGMFHEKAYCENVNFKAMDDLITWYKELVDQKKRTALEALGHT